MLFVKRYDLAQVKFLQEVITQSNSHEYDYSIYCTIFLPTVALKENFSLLIFPFILS